MISAEQISNAFRSNHALAMRLVEGISETEALQTPNFQANCMNWVVGHMVNGRAEALQFLETPFNWQPDEQGLYKTGSDPIRPGIEVPLENLLERFTSSQAMLETALGKANESFLAQVVKTRFGQRPRWQHLSGLGWHETYHAGQLEILRQHTLEMRETHRSPGLQTDASIDTAIVFTKQMTALAAFYNEGLQLGDPNESPGHIGYSVGSFYLGFDQVEEGFESPGAETLWFRVNDLQAVFDRFVALGAQVRYAPAAKPWGDVLAAVYDLDGNVVGLSQRRAGR